MVKLAVPTLLAALAVSSYSFVPAFLPLARQKRQKLPAPIVWDGSAEYAATYKGGYPYQKLFYEILSNKKNHAFVYKDVDMNGHCYRILNYRLASYTDFLLETAVGYRGFVLSITHADKQVHLASLPMEKFYYTNENPFSGAMVIF